MSEEIVGKLRGCFLTIWADARKNQNLTIGEALKTGKTFSSNELGSLALGYEGSMAITKSLKLLHENYSISNKFSAKILTEMIERRILGLLTEAPENIVAKSIDAVRELLNSLETASIKKYSIPIRISNLKLEVERLDIGEVFFSKYDDLPKEISELIVKLSEFEHKDKSEENLKSLVFAVAIVEAFDEIRALELGERILEHSLNVLRLYEFGLYSFSSFTHRMRFGIEGSISWNWKRRIIISGKSWSASHTAEGPLESFVIDSKKLGIMKNRHLEKVSPILGKANPTEFEKRLMVSINRFGKGMHESDIVDSFIDFIIALESILLEKQDASRLVGERTSIIIETNQDQRIRILNKVKELYDERNNIVHRGFIDIGPAEMWPAAYYSYLVIMTLLGHLDSIKDTRDLVNMCNKVKFGGPKFGT
ncbi:MAG: hypothetical protein DA329_12735 [Candidatus Nitrosocosmicus sp.]|nr:hypothetical protein [Candidatus Nitrosocosmicus sp.]